MFVRPFIPLVAACIAGIAWGSRFSEFKLAAFLASASILLLAGVSLYQKNKQFLVASLIPAMFVFGAVSIVGRISPELPEDHISRFARDDRVVIAGVVDSRATISPDRYRMILRTQYLENPSRKATGKFRVTVYGAADPPDCGDTVSVLSKIRRTRNFHNPGGFDYERYMGFKGVWATGYTKPEHVAILKKSKKSPIVEKFNRFRLRIAGLIDTRLEKPEKEIMAALMLGDKTNIPDAERESFSKAGVSHLLAISGLHIGIIAYISYFAFVRLFSWVPGLVWRGWTRKATAVACVFPVLFYGILTGMSISTQRAVIMVIVFLAALFMDRDSDIVNTLAAAGVIILMMDSSALFSVSFQLSFAAVISIIFGVYAIRQPKTGGKGIQALFRRMKMIIWVSVFATLGTAPFIMTYFNSVSLAGPLVNCVMIPVIGGLVVPCGLLSVCFYPFSEPLSGTILEFSAFILSQAIECIHFIAETPLTSVETTIPDLIEIVWFYSLAGALIYFLGGWIRKARPAPGEPGFKLAAAAGIIGLVSLAGDISAGIYNYFWDDELSVTVLDVGQGTSCFLAGPKKLSILIDGGGFYNNDIFDVGHRIVSPYIRLSKFKSLDTVILSHPDSDHMNGLFYIASHYRIQDFWSAGDSENDHRYGDLLDVLSKQGVQPAAFHELPRRRRINGVDIRILYPPRHYSELKSDNSWRNDNNSSIVVKIIYESVSFLFTGDIMADAEAELCELQGGRLKSDVLIAPHHGSKTSGTERFLKTVSPEIVVISCGWKNMFHYPHPEALERYAEYSRKIYRTDINGAVKIMTDGHSLRVRPGMEQNPAQDP